MNRLLAMAAALCLVVGVSVTYAQKTMSASGTVKSVAADMLTVTVKGQDMMFGVDAKTKVIAKGGAHKTAESKDAGKILTVTDLVKGGQKVTVKYDDMAGKMHAAEIRVM